MRIVNIWGLPLRIINWSIAILLGLCFLTAKTSGSVHMLHVGAGYALSVALIYRIVLGFIGSPTARFSAMAQPFAKFREQAEGFIDYRVQRWTGHSPIGGMTAMVLLFMLVFTVISGMAVLNGGDITSFHAAAGTAAMGAGITWLGFIVTYNIFYDRSLLRTLLSGRRIVSDALRGPIAIGRINRLGKHGNAFVWTVLLSAALLPLTYVTPQEKVDINASFPAVQEAMMQTPYQYDENRVDNAVLPLIHKPVFAVNKVNVTWRSSLSTAAVDYASPGYVPGMRNMMLADESSPAELGNIAPAAGDEDLEDTIPVRAQPIK